MLGPAIGTGSSRSPSRTRSSTSSPTTARASPTSTSAGSAAQIWGRFEGGELVAGCHLGANLVPVQCTARRRRRLRRRGAAPAPLGRHDRRAARRRRGVLGADRAALGPSRARSARASPTSRSPSARRRARPDVRLTTPGDLDGALPGLRRDVHRGGRRLAGERRRRRRPLPRAGPAADRARLVVGALRRPGRRLQGGGRLRDAVRRPGAGRVGAPRPPRRRAWLSPAWPPWWRTSSTRGSRPRSRSTSTSGTPPAGRPTPASGFEQTATFATLMF